MTDQALDDKDIKAIKLQSALSQAPRPTSKPNAEWMVGYMDWYFQTRQQALTDT